MRRAGVLLCLLSAFAALTATSEAASYGSARATWQTNVIAQLTVTPNYATGYGPVTVSPPPSPAPAVGPLATSGYVDFGNVVAGYDYLYKDAVQLGVVTNDTNGFTVFAEGSSNFAGGGNTLAIANTLFWLQTNALNNPYSPATSFEATTSATTGGGTGIAYGGAPPATATIWTWPSSTIGQPSNTAMRGYDYLLRLPSSAPQATMDLYVVYTVVAN